MSCIIKTGIGDFELKTLLQEVKKDIFSLLNNSIDRKRKKING